METPGTDSGIDASTSDSSDPSTPAQNCPKVLKTTISAIPPSAVHDDDSASDVSMSAETDDEDEAPSTSTIRGDRDTKFTMDISNKRKFLDSEDIPNGHVLPQEGWKRQKPEKKSDHSGLAYRTSEGKLQQDKSLLPPELWHRILSFIPPRNLGVLLRVNSYFHAYLDPSSCDISISSLSKSIMPILKPDGIWAASRRLFWPGMPTPLKGKSELDMWKLVCSSKCQFCGNIQSPSSIPQDQWHPGPGEHGVVTIWSFGIRTCGTCLEKRSEKEITLLLSPEFPTGLLTALPWVFFSNELHVIPHSTIQSGQAPSTTKIAKTYFQPQIEDIKRESTQVNAMGAATTEEWMKGLDFRGKELRNDAGRWERWDTSGGVGRMRMAEPRQAWNSAPPASTFMQLSVPAPFFQGAPGTNGAHQLQRHNLMQSQFPSSIQTSFPTNAPPRFDSPQQSAFGAYPPRPAPRQERTKDQITELKAARRGEIERRCMLLNPPLTASVLAHMGSFQAAIQIIQPLTDNAWEVLKPRLLSQREDAQQRENERLALSRVVQEQLNNLQEGQPFISDMDLLEQWDDIQAPLRARISGYADETIRDGWAGGGKVSKENCSVFAAQVLMYVRKRFYAEVAKDEAAVRATGRELEVDPPNGPFTRKLTLENMKWVFDTKIKPHTEQYRKELFLCNDCETSKYYGFEGVIQHYAAKHTNALSVGTVVVHWKSEWPEWTPFNPEPPAKTPLNSAYYTVAPSASIQYAAPAPTPAQPPQQNYGYGGYQQAPVSTPMQTPNPHSYQPSPDPYYGHPQYGDQYSTHQNGPYAPPQAFPEPTQSYQTPQYPPPANNLGYNAETPDYSQHGYGTQYPAAAQGYYAPQQPVVTYPAPGPENITHHPSYIQQAAQYGYAAPYTPPAAPAPVEAKPALTKSEDYKDQLQDVAKNAKDVWDSINGLKDIPGSVKVYTIIHHVLKRSRFNFPQEPPLSMIMDGLSSNKDMRKVRNINGLLCKACNLDMQNASSAAQKKHYSFPQLVAHFHFVHEQGVSENKLGHDFDWTKDMVELPDLSRLAPAIASIGKGDSRLKLIGDALPEILAPRQKPVAVENQLVQNEGWQTADRERYSPPPGLDNHDKYYSTAVDSGTLRSESVGPTSDDGQYDPRNPHREPRFGSRVLRHAEEYYPTPYQGHHERSYVELRDSPPASYPKQARVIIHEEAPVYLEKNPRHRDEGHAECRVRRDIPPMAFDEPKSAVPREYIRVNSHSYRSNRTESPLPVGQQAPLRDIRYRQADDAKAQQNRMFDVVAQISEQAKQARERPSVRQELAEGGSEDGELQTSPKPKSVTVRIPPTSEATTRKPGDADGSLAWGAEELKRSYQPQPEPLRRPRPIYVDDERVIVTRGRPADGPSSNAYTVSEGTVPLRQPRVHTYDDRYVDTIPELSAARERSPELVDRRFKHDHVVYLDDRQGSSGMRRTPSSRYARYESVRLEHERTRSKSPPPVYVKIGSQAGQYRERSPHGQAQHQEQIYRTRNPQPRPDEGTYERVPRQEYYRVYADEPTFEYVRVADLQGGYLIRRPVRHEAEPASGSYEDQTYIRRPVYEARPPPSRVEPAYYEEEEYDPRHPEPPPASAARAVRHQ